MFILYKPGPHLDIAERLSQYNDTEGKDQMIAGMNINIHTLDNNTRDPLTAVPNGIYDSSSYLSLLI